jgi:hypothetical protein
MIRALIGQKLLVLWALFFLLFLSSNLSAQITFNGNYTVTPVNNGTGSLVSIPIPGGSGLSITVGQGSAALPLQNINNLSDSTLVQLGDDSWKNVALPFVFPYWGQTFNTSTMYSNGVVQFGRPVPDGGWPNWNNAFCCHGENLRTSTNTNYNYSIMPLWTDLVDYSGRTTYYRGTADSMTYGWYNTSQYGQPNNRSTFELKINSSGAFDVRYGGIFVAPTNYVTIGATGDLSKGEYFQQYNGLGFQGPSTGFSWGALGGTGTVDMCIINPLSSPTCAGYQSAYTTQQCTISALFDPSCPGYQSAYTTQQCGINPLYSTACQGYQQAYHDQQCSVNTLSYTDCPGYATAYLNQQCSINPLYSTTCSGYAAAYKSQQCSLNQLYATDCPGYAQAYFNQQCSLSGLYNTQCPNYGTAYATQQALLQSQQSTTTTTTSTTTSSTTASTTQPSISVSSGGAVSTSVPIVSDTNVNTVITSTSTSTTSTSPSAPVQLSSPAPAQSSSPAATAMAAVVENKQEEKKSEEKKSNDSNSSSNSTTTASSTGSSSSDAKSSDQPKTARQELQERRESAAKAKAVETGKNLGDTMGKAASMEQQAQVQNVVIAAMGYSPAFEAYKVRMPDVPGYKPYSIYKNQVNVDNRRLGYGLFGATDNLHSDMVESQYNKGN